MHKKPKWIKPSSVKSYDDAIRYLRMIDEGKRRAEKSTYEAILTQLFQKMVRISGDCVLRNVPKSWNCNNDITAGHVFSRAVKQYKWSLVNCYPQCLAFGHKILLPNNQKKLIQNIKVGDTILGFNVLTRRITKKNKVIDKCIFMPKKMYEITLENGQNIKCTEDHKFFCNIDKKYKWLEAREILNILHSNTVCDIISI